MMLLANSMCNYNMETPDKAQLRNKICNAEHTPFQEILCWSLLKWAIYNKSTIPLCLALYVYG